MGKVKGVLGSISAFEVFQFVYAVVGLVLLSLLCVFLFADRADVNAEISKNVYDGLKVTVTDEGVSGETPRSVVEGNRAEAIAKLLTVSKSVKVADTKRGVLDRTIDLTFKGKTVTFKVYDKNGTMYIVGDGTSVLEGAAGEKIVKVTGTERRDVINWLKDRSTLQGLLSDGL